MAQSKDWCWTLNNPSGVPLEAFELDEYDIAYCVFQLEHGDSGTAHYQGFTQFKSRVRLGTVAAVFPGCHAEVRRGTVEQAIAYCKKAEGRLEEPVEYGTPRSQGTRNDLAALASLIKTGATELDIFTAMPGHYIRYASGIKSAMLVATASKRKGKSVNVEVYIGPPGCGKTYKASVENPDAYWKQSSKWWDGYAGEECVILDDFYAWFPFHELLRILQPYPYLAEVKGAQRHLQATKFVITSNKYPWEWYTEETMKKYDMNALGRRITRILSFYGEFDSDGQPTFREFTTDGNCTAYDQAVLLCKSNE